jgi:hypothetical protein
MHKMYHTHAWPSLEAVNRQVLLFLHIVRHKDATPNRSRVSCDWKEQKTRIAKRAARASLWSGRTRGPGHKHARERRLGLDLRLHRARALGRLLAVRTFRHGEAYLLTTTRTTTQTPCHHYARRIERWRDRVPKPMGRALAACGRWQQMPSQIARRSQ